MSKAYQWPFTHNLNFFNESEKKQYTYLLKIKLPQKISKFPQICSYFKGYKINFEENFCILNQNKPINQFILVITPEVKYKVDGNNIQYLERVENLACKMFYIKAEFDVEKNIIRDWIFEEEKFEQLPISLPMDSMVLLLNPEHVNGLYFEKNDLKNNKNIINLPEIVIKENISEEALNKSAIEILMASLNNNSIHAPVRIRTKNENDKIIHIKELER